MDLYQDQSGNSVPSTDALGRLTSMVVKDSSGTALVDYRFGYDRLGRLQYEQRAHEPNVSGELSAYAFEMDLAGRLEKRSTGFLPVAVPFGRTESDPTTHVSTPSEEDSFTLDAVGNWSDRQLDGVSYDYSSNPLNQYEEITEGSGGPTALSYDWLGQLLSNPDRDHDYTWDYFGRLSRVETGASQTIVDYRYDANNRRVEKDWASAPAAVDPVTQFVYSGWQLIEERAIEWNGTEDEDVVRARYGYGLGLNDVLWMDRDVAHNLNGDPDPLGQGTPNGDLETRLFVYHDRLGSVVALVDQASGSVLERNEYETYGQQKVHWGGVWDPITETYGVGERDLAVAIPVLLHRAVPRSRDWAAVLQEPVLRPGIWAVLESGSVGVLRWAGAVSVCAVVAGDGWGSAWVVHGAESRHSDGSLGT